MLHIITGAPRIRVYTYIPYGSYAQDSMCHFLYGCIKGMNIVVRNIYVFEYFCVLDTVFDEPILYYGKLHNSLTNITPLAGYSKLKEIIQKEHHYLFILDTVSGEKVYYAHIEAHSTPYLILYVDS